MEAMAQDEEMEKQILECCNLLLLLSASSTPLASSSWQIAHQQLLTVVQARGPPSSSVLLRLLRQPNLPDEYQNSLAKAIAQCCGPCSAPASVRTFIFSNSLQIQVREIDYSQGGLGWKVWGSALVLARRLISAQESIEGKRILELGSGCGLCGLLVAELGASEVVLTDYVPAVLSNLQNNIYLLYSQRQSMLCDKARDEKQESIFQNHDGTDCTNSNCSALHSCITFDNDGRCLARVCLLDWLKDCSKSLPQSPIKNIEDAGIFSTLSMDDKFDWVIGSDVMYDRISLHALAGVIHRRLDEDGQGLFACAVRDKAELDLHLKELDGLGLSVKVEDVNEQDWSASKGALTETDLSHYNQSTFQDIDHYEGGMVVISITHKVS